MTSPYSTGVVGTYPLSGISNIDPLVWLGFKWGSDGAGTGTTVSYSFPTYNASWLEDYYDQEPFQNFQPFTAAQQTAAKQALALWSEVANITFQQVTETPTNVGELRFGNSGAVTNSSSAAWAYTPYTQPGVEWPENGDVWFDKAYAPNLQLQPGQAGFATMLHEIGHAIGLDHPFYEGHPGETGLDLLWDTDQFTVMSYTAELSTLAYASTPQLLDILAIQYIYGANMTTRTGNDTYKFSATTQVNKTIWDAGGIDTIDLSNQTTSSLINLREGTYSRFCKNAATGTSSLLGIAYGVTIENAFGGAGNDEIYGNAVANRLTGGAGRDTITGFEGNDALEGGAGNDTLYGGIGDDWLDGGVGNDKMKGGAGNDTYVINAIGDSIDEDGNTDTDDLVKSSITISLAAFAGIEHVELTGTTAINATGNVENNKLTGNSAANVLNGKEGADTMAGGKGADTYFVDNIGDKVTEDVAGTAGGIDLVMSSVEYTLGDNVEKLTLVAGAGSINGTGNGLNNTLVGNEGANRLDGGTGNDTMTGGKGDDTYVVDSIKDVVNETVLNSAGGGVDTVESSVTFSLATRANIENLTLTGGGNINGTGNALKNEITGNSGNNILDGGIGADVLKGGSGNDLYIFDNVGDTANEEANADSNDSVKSSALIAAFAGIENYTYTGTKAWAFTGTTSDNTVSGGSANDTLNGGDGNDTLLGNGGNDTLIGEDGDDTLDGGAGNDKMMGGAGNDTYVVNALTDSIDEGINADSDDLVKSSVTVSLLSAGFLAIENVILTGATAINAIGNGADNELTGNSGANKLDGKAGADTMTGGNGADTYTVDDVGDQVIETTGGAAGGIDLVLSSIGDYTLGANVEKVTLTGTADIDGTGNSLNNTLTGNEGANVLNGGIGKDTMTGGAGNDYYFVDNVGDVVTETVANGKGGGIDTVESTVTYSLAARVNVDHLLLTGTSNSNGTGNALANEITGNLGNNILVGGAGNDILTGGDGKDKMTGGTGSDTFDFNLVSELDDGDTITDFKRGVGGDFLDISDLLVGYNDQFDEFVSFTYIGTATNVFVDADGLGGGFAAIQLANLSNVHLTNADLASFIVEVV